MVRFKKVPGKRVLLRGNLSPGNRVAIMVAIVLWLIGFDGRAIRMIGKLSNSLPDEHDVQALYAEVIRQKFNRCLAREIGSEDGNYWRTDLALSVQSRPQAAFKEWRNTDISAAISSGNKYLHRKSSGLRVRNVLVCSFRDWEFTCPLAKGLKEKSIFNIRTLSGETIPHPFHMGGANLFPPLSCTNQSILEGLRIHHPDVGALIDWSHTVFVDWANEAAIWMARALPPCKRLVVRVHSFEAFSPWVHFIPWARVDAVVFVAEHIRAFVDEMFDLSSSFPDLEQVVVPNWNDDSRWSVKKNSSAIYSLGMVVYADSNKDPISAIKILQHLISIRPECPWHLHFVGRPWCEGGLDNWETAYKKEFYKKIESSDLVGKISIHPFTRELEIWFEKIGFIISASEREAQPMSILQGMSSGSIPIVRNWPLARKWNGARKVYPEAKVWDEPEQAAQMIAETADDPENWERIRMRAHTEAAVRFSNEIVLSELSKVISGEN